VALVATVVVWRDSVPHSTILRNISFLRSCCIFFFPPSRMLGELLLYNLIHTLHLVWRAKKGSGYVLQRGLAFTIAPDALDLSCRISL
jgi:hypothetical protein